LRVNENENNFQLSILNSQFYDVLAALAAITPKKRI